MSDHASRIPSLLRKARAKGASDVHLLVDSPSVARVNGRLEIIESENLPKMAMTEFLSILDEDQRSRLSSTSGPHWGTADGSLDDDADGGFGPIRIHAQQEPRGTKVTVRLLREAITDFAALRLPHVIKSFSEFPNGLVLVCGPMASGKSTSLAALIQRSLDGTGENGNPQYRHWWTIEDPIEYRFKTKGSICTQLEVGRTIGSFAEGVRSGLRGDADGILIGEARDRETFNAMLAAAEVGTLTFATVHTTDVTQTISRIVNAYPGDEQAQTRDVLASVLRAVVVMRLVRTTDGLSRVPVCEILHADGEGVRAAIRAGKDLELYRYMDDDQQFGMQTMEQALAELVPEVITKEDALKVANRPSELRPKNTNGVTGPRPAIGAAASTFLS